MANCMFTNVMDTNRLNGELIYKKLYPSSDIFTVREIYLYKKTVCFLKLLKRKSKWLKKNFFLCPPKIILSETNIQ